MIPQDQAGVAARNATAVANLGLAGMVVRDLLVRGAAGPRVQALLARLGYDDAEQEARLGLLRAAAGYRSETGYKFSTYAYACVRNHLVRYVLRIERRVPHPTGPRPGGRPRRRGREVRFDPARPPRAWRPAPPPFLTPAEVRDEVRALPERLRDALVVVYYRGLRGAAAGRALGVSRERARQLHDEAVAALRGRLLSR